MADEANKPKVVIVDLDGTLSDHSERVYLAQQRDWDLYHGACINDRCHEDVLQFIKDFAEAVPDCKIVACTARPDTFRTLTFDWFEKHGISELFDDVLMRPHNNFTPDVELKPKMLDEYFGSREEALSNVRMILEDRDRMVKAWRELGFVAWQVREDGVNLPKDL